MAASSELDESFGLRKLFMTDNVSSPPTKPEEEETDSGDQTSDNASSEVDKSFGLRKLFMTAEETDSGDQTSDNGSPPRPPPPEQETKTDERQERTVWPSGTQTESDTDFDSGGNSFGSQWGTNDSVSRSMVYELSSDEEQDDETRPRRLLSVWFPMLSSCFCCNV